MATQGNTPHEVEKCQCLLQGSAKNLADRLYGPQGPPWGTSFDDLERTALSLAGALRKHFLHLALSRQAASFLSTTSPALCPCPSCGRDTIEAEVEPRILHTRAGDAEWLEPQRYCPKCRKAFFPQSKSLGIDLGHYSASLLDLICYAGANKLSFREASLDLGKIGNVCVHEKQVERLSKRIGTERLAERDDQVARFLALPLVERCDSVPAGVQSPGADQVAVIMADAGMLQLRDADKPVAAQTAKAVSANLPSSTGEDTQQASADRSDSEAGSVIPSTCPQENDTNQGEGEEEDDPDQEKPPSGRHWHEDKVGLVLTMHSTVQQTDPCPQVPETFLDADRVAKIVRGMKKSAPLKEDEPSAAGEAEQSEEQAKEETVEYEGPKLEKRQVVASRQSWPLFGPILATAAWLAGFGKAKRKAFVADGARAIWRVWQTRFSSYVPILDFIHAMSYVGTVREVDRVGMARESERGDR
jgi:hypothetical protein